MGWTAYCELVSLTCRPTPSPPHKKLRDPHESNKWGKWWAAVHFTDFRMVWLSSGPSMCHVVYADEQHCSLYIFFMLPQFTLPTAQIVHDFLHTKMLCNI